MKDQPKEKAAAGGGSFAASRGLAAMDIDICPPWWPWPWPGPRRFEAVSLPTDPVPWKELPRGAQVSLQMFRALTLYNMAFQYGDKEAQAQLQRLAVQQLQRLGGELEQGREETAAGAGGSAVARGLASMDIDICPPWWPWPWPGPRFEDLFGPHPDPWKELPRGAQVSLRMFRALTLYNMGFQYGDRETQAQLQQLGAKQIQQLAGELEQSL